MASKLIEAAQEAVAIAKGEQPAARIHVNGHAYVPEATINALVGASRKLILSAKILQQNSEGCALNHYGNDHELHGLPGWLADTKRDIEAASDALTAFDGGRS